MKITVTIPVDVDVPAWQGEYGTTGVRDTRRDVRAYVRELLAASHPGELLLWRSIDEPAA